MPSFAVGIPSFKPLPETSGMSCSPLEPQRSTQRYIAVTNQIASIGVVLKTFIPLPSTASFIYGHSYGHLFCNNSLCYWQKERTIAKFQVQCQLNVQCNHAAWIDNLQKFLPTGRTKKVCKEGPKKLPRRDYGWPLCGSGLRLGFLAILRSLKIEPREVPKLFCSEHMHLYWFFLDWNGFI